MCESRRSSGTGTLSNSANWCIAGPPSEYFLTNKENAIITVVYIFPALEINGARFHCFWDIILHPNYDPYTRPNSTAFVLTDTEGQRSCAEGRGNTVYIGTNRKQRAGIGA